VVAALDVVAALAVVTSFGVEAVVEGTEAEVVAEVKEVDEPSLNLVFTLGGASKFILPMGTISYPAF
jgi:hypothetical protein